jgi:uncharacterized membrane protein (UPF0127 family)
VRTQGIVAAILLAILALPGCSSKPDTFGPVKIDLRSGQAHLQITAEIAATPEARSRGLSGRSSLGARNGMVFTYPAPVRVGFWMKDTLIPLDIAFILAGSVVEIRSMTPCRAEPCLTTTPATAYEEALEVNSGVFAEAGILVGASVEYARPLPRPTGL